MVRVGDADPRSSVSFPIGESAAARIGVCPLGPAGTELSAEASPEVSGGIVGVASVEPPGRVVETGGGNSLAGFVLAAGVVVLTVTVLMRGKRMRLLRHKREAVSAGAAAAANAPALEPRDAQAVAEASRARLVQAEREARSRQTLEALMVEVQELTRLCAGQIENRAVRLERLIAEADARLAELRTLESGHAAAALERKAEAARVPMVSTRSVRATSPGRAGEPRVAEPLPPEALRRSSVLTMQGAVAEPGGGSGDGSGTLEPLTRRVYELADRGMSALDIARRLEEQIGKVQLILSLRRG